MIGDNVTYAYFKSKDEEQALLMTGNDIGFTKWDNELKEALLRAPITFRQYKIFDAIHRMTIGWGKDFDRITDMQISQMTGIERVNVNKAKSEMIKLGLLLMQGSKIGVNQNVQSWNFTSNVAESTQYQNNHTVVKSTTEKPQSVVESTLYQNNHSVAKSTTKSVAESTTSLWSNQSHTKERKESKENILKHKLPQTPSLAKSKSFDPSSVELPDWLPQPIWDSWVQYRKEINKPIKSQQTVIQAIKLLGKCRYNGHQPEEIINASIGNGWQGLFEPNQL
ncbi:replication protein [Arsenophonus sp. PmNCSU2021_1]|uniref:replication protein n=1 Tax=Arsenophonus sp. PmNCSU2021_1 TaxID=3118989 RepID=UPI002FF0523D